MDISSQAQLDINTSDMTKLMIMKELHEISPPILFTVAENL